MAQPVIFISYSHKDEPEHPRGGGTQWLTFVRNYLQPAVKNGVFELWVDQNMPGGTDWDPDIEAKLRSCDIFILLVSANAMASNYIVDKEIAIIRERQANKESVHFYPILLTPTPDAGLEKVKDKNLRPRDAKPLSSFSHNRRLYQMMEIANEIGKLASNAAERKSATQPANTHARPAYVHISRLPETPYERLVGRDAELKRLDDVWVDPKINIVSLIAEGGAGKSALVNEWLKRLQVEDYRGAEMVLGWSFYSQGTKERATSAEEFLNWTLDKLNIELETLSATAKGERIAEELTRRHVLFVIDGVEPLQHGLDAQLGELKDHGLRTLLRHFSATAPAAAHGLIVLTSRIAIKDISHWRDDASPVIDVERLSDQAGAALLRDNGMWGTDKQLEAASRDFGGHPLALGLLSSFLKETQSGDVRRRDRIRAYLADSENPRHDHAKRVMESYEKEWLAKQPVLLAIMQIIGLFDRPASSNSLNALRADPIIKGLTEPIVELDDDEWQRSVARLREVRLLAPPDPAVPDGLDSHPLVREWFGDQLKKVNEVAWKAAHGRLYEHLRDATKEGASPRLEDLAPLYQAIGHGCRAGRYEEALYDIYVDRICRRNPQGRVEFYAHRKLGATGSDLSAISWFFERPYVIPAADLSPENRSWMLGTAASWLLEQGRLAEALPAQRAALRMGEDAANWSHAAVRASNLSEAELIVGDIAAAVAAAERSVAHADRSGDEYHKMSKRATYAAALHAAGRRDDAAHLFADAEARQKQREAERPLLYSMRGYRYCDFLLAEGQYAQARDRATQTLEWMRSFGALLHIALDTLILGQAHLGLALSMTGAQTSMSRADARAAETRLGQAVDGLRAIGQNDLIPRALLGRAALRRSVGDWEGAARDLNEVEEIAELGPMRVYLCDMALERARLAFAQVENFAPLNEMQQNGNSSKPVRQSPEQIAKSKSRAREQLRIAADYIKKCGYHRRDEELAELEAVLRGEKVFTELLPRV